MQRVSGIISKRAKARYSDHTVKVVVAGYRNMPPYMNKSQYLKEVGVNVATMKAWEELVDSGAV
jgi:hypothetical protein